MRLLKSQTRSLLQKIDMDSKMKKMAELQLSVVGDPKNRKAIENQVLCLHGPLCTPPCMLFAPMCVVCSLLRSSLSYIVILQVFLLIHINRP